MTENDYGILTPASVVLDLQRNKYVWITDGDAFRVQLRPSGQIVLCWNPDFWDPIDDDECCGRIDLSDPNTMSLLWPIAESFRMCGCVGFRNLIINPSSECTRHPEWEWQLTRVPRDPNSSGDDDSSDVQNPSAITESQGAPDDIWEL